MVFKIILFVVVAVNSAFGYYSGCELFDAVHFHNLQRLKDAIARSKSVDCRNTNHSSYEYGWTPLMAASDYNYHGNRHVAVVTELLAAGADPNLEDYGGLTALMYASKSSYPGNTGVLQLLVDNGANINQASKKGSRPLHYAITMLSGDTTDVAAILLRAGAARYARDNDEKTPIHLAMQRGYTHLAEFIDDRGIISASSVTKSYYITTIILPLISLLAIVSISDILL